MWLLWLSAVYLVPNRTWCYLRGAWKSGSDFRSHTWDAVAGPPGVQRPLWVTVWGRREEGEGGREVCSVARALS